MFDLLLITPELAPDVIARRVEAALAVAPPLRVGLQLRAKHLDPLRRARLAEELRRQTRTAQCPLLINGEVELARAVGADGVQLPESGMAVLAARGALGPAALIGVSRHDGPGIQRAATDGASFATISPVFSVPDKGTPLGLEGLAVLTRGAGLPLFALGGIRAADAASVIEAGAHGVAVVRDVLGQEQPAAALQELLAALDQGRARVSRS